MGSINPEAPSKEFQNGGSSPFLVFNLFADYFAPFGDGTAWTQDILHLLGLAGYSEQAVRSTLLRMKRKGWLAVTRDGRRSRYRLTTAGRQITAQGARRIFEPAAGPWDGQWQIVVFSLPENKRMLRTELRKKLVWFGFGNLVGGSWITPHDRRAELAEVVGELAINSHVALFSAHHLEGMSTGEIVGRCWDLETLEQQYRTFVTRWRPRLGAFEQDGLADSEDRFRERFQLTYEFQPFPRLDPNLPCDLLPAGWPGHDAREIFTDYRQRLQAGLPQFFDNLSDKHS